METLLHSASGAETGFGKAGENGGGPAWEMGQDPCLMSWSQQSHQHTQSCAKQDGHMSVPQERGH